MNRFLDILEKDASPQEVWDSAMETEVFDPNQISETKNFLKTQLDTERVSTGVLWALLFASYFSGQLSEGVQLHERKMAMRVHDQKKVPAKIVANLGSSLPHTNKKAYHQCVWAVVGVYEKTLQDMSKSIPLLRVVNGLRERCPQDLFAFEETITESQSISELSEEDFETQMLILATNGEVKEMTQYYRENVRSVIAGHETEKESLLFLMRFGHSFFELLENLHYHQFSSEHHHQLGSQIKELSGQLVSQMEESGQTIEEQELAQTGVLPGSHAHEMMEELLEEVPSSS
jgi:hypothetical protein